jgi:hypothetical protein
VGIRPDVRALAAHVYAANAKGAHVFNCVVKKGRVYALDFQTGGLAETRGWTTFQMMVVP